MSDGSTIEWTDATWQPITGCSMTRIERDAITQAALRTAISHIEHMAAWIGKQNSGYSFESLGEDMPTIRAALASVPPQDGAASDECLRCAICGFVIDRRYEATRPTVDFTMAGRTKTKAAKPIANDEGL